MSDAALVVLVGLALAVGYLLGRRQQGPAGKLDITLSSGDDEEEDESERWKRGRN